ncbi:type II toxin-antitoxin system ParD family antitoxin [Microvirga arsenatis]|uniref:Type II toxin-antitoxin system ParD family antitoxin n=1 Tax=Microvirga arsenatis TaxID=2692265 RepID=A0ABW9Z6M0_9HYPH|nr:type II toxin-antitoxin system ParD family antitoxin [Microvirga arsenatis]NBJ13890.1 type II toxin-antitoxin system ParD family antitoxin [Microvirga arsenatis]NBJ27340.1 type II toxin-antitoxin system ParD family antitoxin [Microvirga arsenatis]
MRTRKTRNVSLTPELEALVDNKVASGRYRSASEVVRAALRLLDERERRIEQMKGAATGTFHAG